MTSDRFNEFKKSLETGGVELAASDLSKQVPALAEAAKIVDENSVARLVANLAPAAHVSDSVAELAKGIEKHSVASAAAELGSVAQLSTSLADAGALIESLRLDRSTELAQELSQQVALSQAALREAAAAPALQLREGFAAFGAERSSFLETIRNQLLESQASFRASISAPVFEMQRQLTESVQLLTIPKFRLPAMEESRALTAQMFEAFRLPKTHMEDAFRTLADGMKGMTMPWLDIQHELQSIRAFTGLQDLGHVLNAGPSFDERTSDIVRVGLGDWQAPVTLPDSIAEIESRTAFYRGRGVDAALAQFPSVAFDQAITIARIKRPPPGLVITFRSPTLATTPEEEEGHALRNIAHDYLQRFETQIRQFIDARMTATFGPQWQKQHVPGEIHKSWKEKRQKYKESGQSDVPLIAFADFTDYEPIISRGDNWDQLFAAIFNNRNSVRESFQRLYPIRLATMHAREVGQEDLLLLHVEILILAKAMGTSVDKE